MFIINFIFVYVLAGFILGNLLIILSKKSLHTTLAYLLGYGTAPLVISVMLYYLYWCFPQREWFFYTIIIAIFWSIVLAICLCYKTGRDCIKIRLRPRDFISALQKLSITGKVLIGVIVFIVGFTFIRGQLYPTLWADAIYYVQQGHVYSVDRSLDRLTTQIPFLEDGSNYVMNPSIRPAIPILYSFFYTTPASQDIFIFSGSFLYFYYFILLLGMFCHVLKRLRYDHDRIVLGLVLLVSSYYLINFLIFGFKEIILMFFILTALWIGYSSAEYTTRTKWLLSMCIGVFIGLAIFINVSGVIIGGIIGMIYLIELFAHKVPFKQIVLHSIVIGFFLTLFSGGDLKYDFDFIFKRTLLDTSLTIGATAASELTSYKIIQPENSTDNIPVDTSAAVVVTDVVTEPDTSAAVVDEKLDSNQSTAAQAGLKKQVLLKGKLQGFTQIQFYGIIFWLFAAILAVRIIQHRQFTHFEKSILGFFWLFFFIVMDPLFLNRHAQAYVLSISPKYTIVLIPLAVLFVTINYTVLLKLFARIDLKYLLLSSVGILLLFPGIRNMVVPYTLNLFEMVIPLYNAREYYLHKFDLLYVGLGVLFFVMNVLLCYFIMMKATADKKSAAINLLFVIGSVVFPFLFLLNNNYNIVHTFRNIFAAQHTQLRMIETNEDALAYLDAIHYLNTKTDPTTKILFFYYRPSLYYIEDYHRFVAGSYIRPIDESDKSLVYVQDADYIVVYKTDLESYNFSQAVELEQEFNSVVLLRVFY